MTDDLRKCPNCGKPERRWTVGGIDRVNLDPFTNNCVTCLGAMAKETGPIDRRQESFTFDARAAAAGDHDA